MLSVDYTVVSLDKGIDLILSTAESPNISKQTSIKTGFIKFSPVVKDFLVLAIRRATRPPRSPRSALVPDLLRIFRNRNHCLIIGEFNAKHRSWNRLSTGNPVGTELYKFAVNCDFLITAPAEVICLLRRTGSGSIIDFGISCDLQDLRSTTLVELSCDHNPVVFDLQPNFPYSYAHNCLTLTNWNRFQDILSLTVPGNPRIKNPNAIHRAVTHLKNHIQNAIKQSSRFKFIKHQATSIPLYIRQKIKGKNRLRKRWQNTFDPELKRIVNKLQHEIKKDLLRLKQQTWDRELEGTNYDIESLHKIIERQKKKQVTYPPLLGYRGLVYGTVEKTDIFDDSLEESFKENRTPYVDFHITAVNRAVRRYIRDASL
ncbi:putative RNA-directed DNA polymerase from transposon X-element [Trichonephila clavata]|uniref:Putative RNA-directed DNA polymerase from transposon X-element n=1 Tax=Trichonephila clavata TaxID=2740835 RepID=A0A8X6G4V4_TRICU|nr:putative RNA-directed DNA polymerase from transposon X-element [Trichonephila clavata]